MQQPLLGNAPAVEEQQRRKKQKKEYLRPQLYPDAGEQAEDHAQRDLHQGRRQGNRRGAAQRAAGDHGQEQDEACSDEFQRAVPAPRGRMTTTSSALTDLSLGVSLGLPSRQLPRRPGCGRWRMGSARITATKRHATLRCRPSRKAGIGRSESSVFGTQGRGIASNAVSDRRSGSRSPARASSMMCPQMIGSEQGQPERCPLLMFSPTLKTGVMGAQTIQQYQRDLRPRRQDMPSRRLNHTTTREWRFLARYCRGMKFPRFRGHPSICVAGVHDGKKERTLHAGVSASDD